MTAPPTSLDKALALAGMGLKVFPCGPDKRPLTKRGFYDASSDPDRVRELWAGHDSALVGVSPPDKTIVVDIDGPKGMAAKANLQYEGRAQFPETSAQRTPSGGEHRFYRWTGPNEPPQVTKYEGVPIDTRVSGKGYIIAYSDDLSVYDVSKWQPAPEWVYTTKSLPKDDGITFRAEEQPDFSTLATRDDITRFLGSVAAGKPVLTEEDYYAMLAYRHQLGSLVDLKTEEPWTDRDLRKLASEAQKWTREEARVIASTEGLDLSMLDEAVRASYLDGLVSLSAFLTEEVPPIEWLVDGLVPMRSTGVLIGQWKAGKSLAGLQLTMEVARKATPNVAGTHVFMGRTILAGGPTVFVEYEGSRGGLQHRARVMTNKFGLAGQDVPLDIMLRPPYRLDTDEGEAWLTAITDGRVLCVIGPASKAVAFENESDQYQWQRLHERIQNVTDKTKCTIMLIHHTRKPAVQYGPPTSVEDVFNSARGSNAYVGAADFGLAVQRKPDKLDGKMFWFQRDGESSMAKYAFDPMSLIITYTDAPSSDERSVNHAHEEVIAWLKANPGFHKREVVAVGVGKSKGTVEGYSAALASDERVLVDEDAKTKAITWAYNTDYVSQVVVDEE